MSQKKWVIETAYKAFSAPLESDWHAWSDQVYTRYDKALQAAKAVRVETYARFIRVRRTDQATAPTLYRSDDDWLYT
jgi:hypothetical protein